MSASFSTGLIGGNFVIGDNRIISVSPSSGTDTAGQNLTIQSGRGTGTGTGGSIIFQTAPGGSSGSSANDPATKLTVTVEGIQVAGTGSMSDTLSLTKSSGTGLSVTKDATIGGNLTVTGNLTVSGTSTTINTATLDVEDINITLAKGNTTPANANGGGITLKAGSDKTIIYDQSQDRWTSNIDWNIASGKVFKINGSSVLSSTALGSTVVGSSLTSVGTLSSLNVSGSVGIGMTPDNSNNILSVELGTSDRVHFHTSSTGGGGAGLMVGDTYNSTTIPMYYITPQDNVCLTGTRTNHSIDIKTNWTSRIFIKNDGNVGIGDTTPSYKLDVNGTGRFTGALTANVTGNLTGSVLTASQTAITGLGTITTGTWNATTIAIAKGGTGATSASAARTALGVDAAGTVNYTLPTASASALGGVKVGSGLSISSGVLSATGSSPWSTSGSDINYTSGEVGIGVTSPNAKLDLKGSSTTYPLQLRGGASGGVQSVFTWSGNPWNSSGYAHYIKTRHDNTSDAGNAFDFYVWQTSDSGNALGTKHVLTMDATGVGIGTTSPDAKLHINGGKLLIIDNANSAGAGEGRILGGHTDNAHAIHFRKGEDGTTDVLDFHEYGKIRFYTNGALSSQTEKMCILSNGNVGIGTDSPLGTLHIQVSEQYENGLFISSSHGTYGSDSDGGVYHFNHYNHATSTRRGLLMQERNTTGVFKRNIMIFQRGTGNVGIGSGSNGFIEPSHKLDVNGTGRFTGDLTAGANLTVTGNLIVNGTTTTVNSTTMTVDDPIITLGGDTAPGSDDNKDRGVEFRYYDGSAKVGFMGWDDSAGSFVVLKDATNSSEVFSGTAAELKVGSLTIGSDTVSNLSSLLTTSSALSSLSNVATTAPSNNQVLTWNGSAWAPADASGGGGGGASALNDLSDVSTSGAQTNYALVYNGSSWAPAAQSGGGGGGGGASSLNGLSDVNTSGVEENYVLVYKNGSWIPAAQSGGDVNIVPGDDFSPSGATLTNENGTTHARDRGDVGNLIDGNTSTATYVSSASTVASHGPFIISVDIPSTKIGQELYKVIIKKSYMTGYGTTSFKVGYRRSSTNYSLNVSSVDMTTSTGTVQTGTVTFSNDSNWHVTGITDIATVFTLNLTNRITLATGDKILIRWLNTGNFKHIYLNEITLTGSRVVSAVGSSLFPEEELLSYDSIGNGVLVASSDSGENFNNDYKLQHFFDGDVSSTTIGGHSSNVYNSSGNYTGSSTTNGYAGVWVQQQYSEKVYVTKLRMIPRGTTEYTYVFPKEMKVFGSDNGVDSWVEIQEIISLQSNFGANTWTTKDVYATTAYKYIRIVFHKSFGHSSDHAINFRELQIIGRRVGTKVITTGVKKDDILVYNGSHWVTKAQSVAGGNNINLTTTKVRASWEELSVTGGPPTDRYDAAVVVYNNKLIVSGGAPSPRSDTWELDLSTKVWVQKTSLTSTTPDYARHVNAIRYSNKMFVWGGVASGNVRKLWQLNLDTYQWSDVTPSGMVHPNRYYGVALWNSKIIYFGGHDDFTSTGNQNVVTEVDVSGSTYTRIVKIANGASGSPPGRIVMGTSVYEDKLYMFGGYASTWFNDLWELDLLSYSWNQITYGGSAPPARSSFQMRTYNDKIYIFGGGAASNFNDLWELDLKTFNFTMISTGSSSPPSARYGQGMDLYDNALYIFGGVISGGRENDTWKLILPQTEPVKLGDLDDVTTVGSQESYTLVYNGNSWIPAAQSGSTHFSGTVSTNVVHQRMTDMATLSIAGSGGKTEIEGLRLTITPQSSLSKLELNYSIFNQFSNHNAGFVVSRTVGGTETFLTTHHTNSSTYDLTFIHSSSMSDYTTQPMTTSHSMIDEPNTTGVVVYKVYGKSSGGTAITLYINRTGSDSNDANFEHGISTSSVKEFSTFTHNIAEQKVQGRVLETLTGVCDGRSISVSSGTYTLTNVTVKQDMSTTYSQATGSSISYKPPPGTRQVIYKYFVYVSFKDANTYADMFHHKIKLDGQFIGNSNVTYRGAGSYAQEEVCISYVFDIGENDLTNGKVASWDTLKTIEVYVRDYDDTVEMYLHHLYYLDAAGSVNLVRKPRLEITAIGEENLVYNLTNQYSITEGQVLETLAGVCDGRSVSVSSGTYTLPTIESTLALTTTFTDIGTSFSYKPPPGTRQIIYTMKIHTQGQSAHSISYYRLFVDNTEVTAFRQGHNGIHNDELMILTWIFTVADVSSDDIANGRFVSWNSNKTIMIKGAHIGSGNAMKIFGTVYEDGSTTYQFVAPILEIQAIGRGVLEGTISNLYSAKVNMVTVQDGEKRSFVTPRTEPGVEIPSLRLTIKPIAADSIIELKWNLFCDCESNTLYRVTRNYNGTDVQVYDDTHGYTGAGIGVHTWDTDDGRTTGSTPQINTVRWYDKPGTTETITYKLFVGQTHYTASDNYSFWLNQTIGGGTTSAHENGVSTGVAIEHPQQTIMHNPRYNSVIDQEGQVLETLAGSADGRSITVSSGTYTLENVDTDFAIDASSGWMHMTGSTVNYKPPPGTRQIIYKYTFNISSPGADNASVFTLRMSVNDTGLPYSYRQYAHGTNLYGDIITYTFIFDVGSEDNSQKGKYLTWDSSKELSLDVLCYHNSYQAYIHGQRYGNFNSSGMINTATTESHFSAPPLIEIKAIGRKSDTTFLNSFFNERKGQVLETLSGTCDGRTIEVDSGTYTLANITTGTSISSTTYVDFPGSSIAYKPPAGTKQVIYKFNSLYARISSNTSIGLTFFIDNTEVTSVKEYFGTADDYGNNINQTYVINIDGTDDIPNGRLSSWDSLKTLKIKIAAQSGYGIYINRSRYEIRNGVSGSNSSTTLTDYLYKPNLEIQAIGDAAIQNATVVAGNSMVHFQGYSNTFTVTNSIPYITGYQDAPTAGTFTTGLPVLKNFGNCMNTGTGIFTTPHTGLYSINVVVHKENNTSAGKVTLVIDGKQTSFGDSIDDNDNSGVSSVYHIDSGKQVYLKSVAGSYPSAVNLSITALQDQVPQAISARPGMTLETLVGVCDGRSVTVSSGTYTLPNQSASQDVTVTTESTAVDVTGSIISYKPPPGTRQVIYEFHTYHSWHPGQIIGYYCFYIDNVAFRKPSTFEVIRPGHETTHLASYRLVVDIGTADDASKGQMLSWNTLKTIKMKAYKHSSSSFKLNFGNHTSTEFSSPTLEIRSIGDGPGIVPSTGTNMVHVSDSTYFSTTITAKTIMNYEYQAMRLVIKPTATDSVIELKYSIFAEMDHNNNFKITRNINGTDVLLIPSTNFNEGIIGLPNYDQDYTTTPQNINFTYYDEPGTIGEITYKLWVGSSHISNKTLYFNGGNSSTGGNYHELGVSNAAAIEYPKTSRPLDTENALTIPPFVGATNKEKLYNQSGDLYFNGKQLSNEWYKNGEDLYRLGANVGIGKTTPGYKLDVVGDINFTGSIRHNGSIYGAAGNLTDLTDVDTSGAQTNHALVYNGNTWVPSSQSTEYYSAHIQNISDLNMYHGYEISSSGYHNSLSGYRPETAFFTEEGSGSGAWHSLSGKYNASSGNYTGSTSTNGYNGEWIQINFGKKAKVYYYGMRPQSSANVYYQRAPGNYKLFGSNDGSAWTEVHTGSGVASDYEGGWPMKRNTLPTPATYQYFRLVVNKLVGGGSDADFLTISYLGFYGTFEEPDLVKGAISVNSVQSVDTSTHLVNCKGTWRRWGVAEGGTSGGLEATITPQSSSSKIKLSLSLVHGTNMDSTYAIRIIRTIGGVSTPIMIGSGGSTAAVADNTTYTVAQNTSFSLNLDHQHMDHHTATTNYSSLDEPGTTSPVTYHIQVGSFYSTDSNTYKIRFNKSPSISVTPANIDSSCYRSTMILEEFSTFTHNIAEQKVQGRVLETLAGVCDGRSITVSSGTYTLENVTASQTMTTAWVKATGSEISYKPPPGTTVIKFTFRYAMRYGSGGTDVWHQVLYLDGTQVSSTEETVRPGSQSFETINQFVCILSIGGTNDVANGKLASWDTLKKLEVRMGSYESIRVSKLHITNLQAFNDSTDLLIPPQITIEAIGEENLVYNLTNQYSITEGQVLETLAGQCDGQSIIVSSGTYTIPSVTQEFALTTSYQDIPGTSISYKPPSGTRQVIYNFYFAARRGTSGSNMLGSFKLFLDSTEVTAGRKVHNGPTGAHMLGTTYKFIFNINGTDDIANGKLSSWNTLKTLKLQAREYGSSDQVIMFRSYHWEGSHSAAISSNNIFVQPSLEIQAIGRGVIEGTISNLYSSKVNMVKATHLTPQKILASKIQENDNKGYNVSELNLAITPTGIDSIIGLEFNIFGEMRHNCGYRITRNINGTDVLVTPMADKYSGFLAMTMGEQSYGSNSSFPQQDTIQWYDTPNTTSTVTYKLWIGSSVTDGGDVYINSHANADSYLTGNTYREIGVSSAAAIEYPQQTIMHNPRYNSVIEQEGQALETMAGICDGRSVSVSSGTYTLQNVTTSLSGTTTFTDLTGSKINYKPPPGTRQVIYEFEFQHAWDGTKGWGYYKFLLDGTQVGEIFEIGFDQYGSSWQKVSFVFEIGQNDLSNGKISSWDSHKEIKMQFREHASNSQVRVHTAPNNGYGLIKPRIKVQAIGRKSDTTFLNSFFNERKGQVLETLTGVCDGRTITVDSGTYTLENITTGTKIDESTPNFIDFPGSSITYKPPPGTRQVYYSFKFIIGRYDSHSSMGYKFFIDGTEVTSFKRYDGMNGNYGQGFLSFDCVIEIGGTNDIPNGKLSSWNTLKTLKVQVAQEDDYGFWLNKSYYDIQQGIASNNASNTATTYVRKPSLKVEAIGDAAIQNATVVAGHSTVHFQGFSTTYTVTSGTKYVTNYGNAPSTGVSSGIPQLKNFGNAMNTSTGIFTTPHTGLYNINAINHHQNKGTNTSWVELVIDNKHIQFGDHNVSFGDLGASAVYHIEAGKEVYLRIGSDSNHSDYEPTAVSLTITALQDQVPQAISSRPGMTLETLSGVCDGRTVTVSSGTYTFGNVTAEYDPPRTSWGNPPNMGISYKPPAGTRQVVYKIKIFQSFKDTGSDLLIKYKLYIDGVGVTDSILADSANKWSAKYHEFSYIIRIGEGHDPSNGKFSSWDSLKLIETRLSDYGPSDTWERYVHSSYIDDGLTSDWDSSRSTIRKPKIEIQAIGDGPGIVPSTGTNVVTANFSTQQSINVPHALPGYHVSELDLVIKPTATDSVIELKFNLFGDLNENVCFRIKRNDDFVVPATSGTGALAVVISDKHEEGSTPITNIVRWYDQPNTTSEITYKLYINTSEAGHNNEGGWINRSKNDSSTYDEKGVSTSIAIEYPKTARPLDTENALTIPPFVGAINKEKLYNQSGDLYFNGKQLSNEWYKNGGDLYRLGANVGIGKSSPAYKLDVTGDINFTSSLRKNGTALGEWNASGSDIYRSTGNVGIGDMSPGAKLEIRGTDDTGESYVEDILRLSGKYNYQNAKYGLSWYNEYNQFVMGAIRMQSGSYTNSPKMFFYNSKNQSTPTIKMTIDCDGRVGIGTTTPSTALHIYTIDGSENTGSRYQINSSGGASGSGGSGSLSLRVRGRSWFEDYTFHTSDSRIKKEIEDVPDNLALQQVRNIPCKYYKYVDTYEKGDSRTIGFIAQEVKSVLPMAVSIETGIIPNIYKVIQCEWTGSVMSSQELGTVSGVKYKFYVSNTDNDEVEKIVTGNDDNTFTFEQQWNNVFCYGREVDDFHTVDKNKLFALNFSATQELDRQQQVDKAKIASLETKVASLESELAAIKAHLGL